MSAEGRLEFGTAGIRGRMGPGPDELNLATITRVAAGIAAYLRSGSVVIGYDARRDSDTFARQIAVVLNAHGLRSQLLPRALPTPVLAASIRSLDCAAGIMVTASHNPAADNGVKVYLADGIQIIPPADRGIAALIASIDAGEVMSAMEATTTALDEHFDVMSVVPDSVVQSYVDRVARLCMSGSRDLRIAHTALHGVGWPVFAAVMMQAGFLNLSTVPVQQLPDADFPTAPFPNPEIPGVLDLLMEHAREIDADLAIAHDPDADRCAVAVRADDGDLELLTGDELGAFLGWWILERMQRGTWPRGAFASSIVSSTLLGRMAAAVGVPHHRTLTGFKWIARVPDLVYGYEEALGYCVAPAIAGDKDGISAALIVAEACAHLRAEGRSPREVLEAIAAQHGRHLTGQRTLRAEPQSISAAMNRLRATPPTVIGGQSVTRVHDFATGDGYLPPTDLIEIGAAGVRAMVRPSGTEPLLKCYAEVVVRGTGSREEQEMSGRHLLAVALDDVAQHLMPEPEGSAR